VWAIASLLCVASGEEGLASGPHALLLLDLAALVALAGPTPDGADVGRVLQQQALLL